ncbi:hypothetical protein K449DRAFT_467900 [Hypoxylon sp. EC38]|nr:hypothetical protein K449DRAFT_467900 [Hypoxylon sp. EC38]
MQPDKLDEEISAVMTKVPTPSYASLGQSSVSIYPPIGQYQGREGEVHDNWKNAIMEEWIRTHGMARHRY